MPSSEFPVPLNCPFCGQEPWGIFGPNDRGECWVECHGTDASICGDWHFEGTRLETALAWNRRTVTAPLPEIALAPTGKQVTKGMRVKTSSDPVVIRAERSGESSAQASVGEARFFACGPSGHCYTASIEEAETWIAADASANGHDAADDYTVTDCRRE